MRRLLFPERVAVIGESFEQGCLGRVVADNLLDCGFGGDVQLVCLDGPRELRGRTCRESLGPSDRVDLALVATAAARLKQAVDAALRARPGHLVVLTPLDREGRPEAHSLHSEILRRCRDGHVRLLGPGSLGVINVHHHLHASYLPKIPVPGGISALFRSSALASALIDWLVHRGQGASVLIGLGDRSDVDESDLFEALKQEEQTRVVIGYLERIRSGEDFVKHAESLSSTKPVVLLKAGATEAGEQAVLAHTGQRVASEVAFGAAFKRSGVIQAHAYHELLDYSRVFAAQPLPRGDRVGVVTNAGGAGILAADAAERAGLKMARLEEATIRSLKHVLPAETRIDNPVDLLGDADAQRFAAATDALQADPGVDALLLVFTPHVLVDAAEIVRGTLAVLSGEKPVLASFMGGTSVVDARAALVAAGVPDYPSPERAVAALGALCEYAAWRRRPPRVVTRFRVNRRRVERIIRRHQRQNRLDIEEFQAKELLEAYGFNIPEGALVASPEEAVETAERIGYPVAMKIVSADIVRKSTVGGVRLDLTTPDMVRDAYDLIMLRIARRLPDAHVEGVYVEKMCRGGGEVVIGMHRDPQFGPMLMFGLGGIAVEVMEDVAFHLAPITFEEAMQMLASTRSYAQLEASRDRVDMGAIATGLQLISQLATDFPQILELEIHPYIVGRTGTESVAADARILLA
ncbi:MAG: acetate--CoA ligase family protein [Deltaproteobacteria bacterium]|nr:acetate--CoA ligase family protein [Deltaproteobacteria bacterium]